MENREMEAEFFSEAGRNTFRHTRIENIMEDLLLSIPYGKRSEIVFWHTNSSMIRYYLEDEGNFRIFEGTHDEYETDETLAHTARDFRVNDLYSGRIVIYGEDLGVSGFMDRLAGWVSLFAESYLRNKVEIADKESFAAERTLSYFKHNSSNLLCGISGLMEFIDMECDSSNIHKSIKSISTALEEFEHEISQVRDIIQGDYRSTGDLSSINVSDLLEDELRSREQIGMFEECIKDILQGVFVTGSRELLKKAFNHIFDNISEIGGEKPRVEISLKREERVCVIIFSNRGDYIPFWDQEIVFHPLVSLKKSNSLGLGLAYVKKIIQRHHGKIEMTRPHEYRGMTLEVRLPVARDIEKRG